MGGFVHSLLKYVFGDALTDTFDETMQTIFQMLEKNFSDGGIVTQSLTLFAAISASLLILFFFMSLVDMASRDMFSLEKLIVAFVKFIAGFAIIICIAPIMNGIVQGGHGLYQMVDGNTFTVQGNDGEQGEVTYYSDKGSTEYVIANDHSFDSEEALENIKADFKGWGKVKDHLGLIVFGFLPMAIGWLASGVAIFLVISNALQVIVRGMVAPLAIVQLFDEGMRSSGIRFIKKFAGSCFMFSVILLINKAGTVFTQAILAASYDGATQITESNIDYKCRLSVLLIALVVKLAVVGSMVGAGRLSDEVWGA